MLRILFIVVCLVTYTANAQKQVQATVVDGKAYIGHAVGNGETLYGIARIYGILPKDLASFNNLDMKKGLEKNSVLKIPATPATISAKPCSGCATIKYAVQPHEGLYRIGLNFGNVGKDNIVKLNKLTSENLATGQELIVGYMKATGNEVDLVDNSKPVETVTTVQKEQPPVVKEAAAQPKQDVVVAPPTPRNNAQQQPKQNVVTTQPVNVPVEKKQEPLPAVREEPSARIIAADGVFGSQFNNRFGQNKSGTAGIFKSISGWQDKKYYALINSVDPGTILKISNPTTGKAIFAKVLGQIPMVKGADSLLLRISDAGAVALDSNGENMQVTVAY